MKNEITETAIVIANADGFIFNENTRRYVNAGTGEILSPKGLAISYHDKALRKIQADAEQTEKSNFKKIIFENETDELTRKALRSVFRKKPKYALELIAAFDNPANRY